MHTDEATSPDDSSGTDTPVFDATVDALAAAAPPPDGDSAGGDSDGRDTDARRAGDPEDADQDWVDRSYSDPDTPTPAFDADTPEAAAIVRLVERLHDIVHARPNSARGDVLTELVNELHVWFAESRIEPDDRPMAIGRRLRLAVRECPGGGLASSVYGVRIGTDHADPEPIIRAALRVLARHLGPGTGIDLVARDRDMCARVEQHPFPTTGS